MGKEAVLGIGRNMREAWKTRMNGNIQLPGLDLGGTSRKFHKKNTENENTEIAGETGYGYKSSSSFPQNIRGPVS